MHNLPFRSIGRSRLWVAAVFLCFGTLATAGTTPSKLLCSPCSVAFGTVKIGSSKSVAIAFHNSGGAAISISSFSKSGVAWVSPRGLSLPYRLAAGKSISFNLVYVPKDGRVMDGTFTYHSNATNRNLGIRISGTASTIGMLVANPSAQSFGTVQVGTTATRSQTLTNQSDSNVSISKVTSGSPFSVGGISTPVVLAPGHSVTFHLHFSPTATGMSSGRVSIASNAKDSSLTIGESGTGTISGTASVSPTALIFGSVAVGSKKALSATLKATGAGVTIRSASFSSNEYSLSGLSLPHNLGAGQSVSFQVIFAPKSSGAANASVSFATSTSTSVQASLQGSGAGGGSGHVVNLSWKGSTSQVIGYNVYRGTKSGGPYSQINSSSEASTAYADSSVQAGTTYYYVVTAVNNKGQESVHSNQASAKVP